MKKEQIQFSRFSWNSFGIGGHDTCDSSHSAGVHRHELFAIENSA